MFQYSVEEQVATVNVTRENLDLTIANEFSAALDQAEANGETVLIDLEAVNYLDSVIISLLVKRHVSLRQQGRRLILFELQNYVRELLHSTGLLGVMDIKSDRAGALRLAKRPLEPEEIETYVDHPGEA